MRKIIRMASLTLALIGLILSTSCSPSKTPTITTNSLPEGVEGVAYSQTLQVHGGTPPYTWFAMATLPPGLQLDPLSGVISGTPLAGWGPAFVSFQVTDHTGMGSFKQLLITVNPHYHHGFCNVGTPNNIIFNLSQTGKYCDHNVCYHTH